MHVQAPQQTEKAFTPPATSFSTLRPLSEPPGCVLQHQHHIIIIIITIRQRCRQQLQSHNSSLFLHLSGAMSSLPMLTSRSLKTLWFRVHWTSPWIASPLHLLFTYYRMYVLAITNKTYFTRCVASYPSSLCCTRGMG